MKKSPFRFLAAFLLLSAAIIGLGNSGGTAAAGNFFTGAPSAGGGTESTCGTCHRSGNFGDPQIAVTLTDAAGTEVSDEYLPGETYFVTVAVGYGTDVVPAGYGFSSQFLDAGESAAPVNVGTVANPGGNTRITDGSNGRTYVEHAMRSADSLFTFEWTAPAAGTGEVRYYVSGNLVNNAAGTGGDNGSREPTIVSLAEGRPSSVGNPRELSGRLFPNPATNRAWLTLDLPASGVYDLRVMDLSGRTVLRQTERLAAGPARLEFSTANLARGVYAVTLSGAGGVYGSRLGVGR